MSSGMVHSHTLVLANREGRRVLGRLVALLGSLMVFTCLAAPASATVFVWGNGACWTIGSATTASGFVPVNSVSRSHTHTTSTTGGVFDNGLAIVQVPGVGACSYTLNPTGSTFTINADGSGTSTVNWTAVATNPVKCGPSFTSHAASISGANGTVAVGSDTNGSFVSKCDSQ